MFDWFPKKEAFNCSIVQHFEIAIVERFNFQSRSDFHRLLCPLHFHAPIGTLVIFWLDVKDQ